MPIDTLTIVGVGLIGGSIGLAAKRRGVVKQVIGVGRQRRGLDQALAIGAIDAGHVDLEEAVALADVTVFCTPVDKIAEQALRAAAVCKKDALLTDAGSTKTLIVRAIERGWQGEGNFVGSHPLAGSEKRGPEHADADLFQSRLTVITQTARTDLLALERTRAFWQSLGSRVQVMSPEDHDRGLAMSSHLPHLTAAALAAILPEKWQELAATGFRDTTRIAAGDPGLWTAIFDHNADALLAALAQLEQRLGDFRSALAAHDGASIRQLLLEAKRRRDALGN